MFNLSIFLEGMLAAMVMGLVAVVFEIIKICPFNLVVSLGRIFVKKGKNQALAASLGWVIHLIIGGLTAEIYYWLVINQVIFTVFNLSNSLVWATFLWLMTMLLIMPLLEAGIFAVKLGRLKWLEMLFLFLVYGFALNYLILSLLFSS